MFRCCIGRQVTRRVKNGVGQQSHKTQDENRCYADQSGDEQGQNPENDGQRGEKACEGIVAVIGQGKACTSACTLGACDWFKLQTIAVRLRGCAIARGAFVLGVLWPLLACVRQR